MQAASESGPDRSERTMTRLLDATGALIAEIGWDNTSSRKVAERAGVSLGVVHYHVSSIVELRRLAALRVIEQYFAGVTERVIGQATNPAEALRVLFGALADGDAHSPALSVLFQSLVAATFDEELRRVEAEMLQQYRELVTAYLAAHEVPDPRATAATLVATADGYLLQRALDPDLDPEPVMVGLARLVATAEPGAHDDVPLGP